jgi:hypothetical protein
MSNPGSPEIVHDIPRPSKMKKVEEVQYLSSVSWKTASISPKRGGDEKLEEMKEREVKQKKGKVTPPRDETDPLKKRKVSPQRPSSQKKSKATMNKMKTVLTAGDFDFIIVALNDTSVEIVEKKEAKMEEMYARIEVNLQGVQ